MQTYGERSGSSPRMTTFSWFRSRHSNPFPFPGQPCDMSQIQLHADVALNAMANVGRKPADIDGVATAGDYHA